MKWRCTQCHLALDVSAKDFPLNHCGLRHDFPLGVMTSPGLIRRASNFTRASAKHLASGSKLVDDATRQWRLEQCLSCVEYYDPERETCSHPQCGCGIKKKRGIIDKLGWASQKCPIGRWTYQSITTRNLIYHVCPLPTNDGWRQNIRQLLRRWHVFNGRKIIAIARGPGLEWEQVHSEFQGEDYEFFYVENDERLREVKSFLPLLEAVMSTRREEATFYAHTKGNSTAANMRGAIRWRNAMYLHLLEQRLAESMKLLETHAFVGCHKMVWGSRKPPYPSGLDHGTWFLAGTFFWFRHDIVFGHPKWHEVPDDRYGAEAWPAGLLEHGAAASVYQKFDEHQSYNIIDNPYNPALYDGEDLDDPAA